MRLNHKPNTLRNNQIKYNINNCVDINKVRIKRIIVRIGVMSIDLLQLLIVTLNPNKLSSLIKLKYEYNYRLKRFFLFDYKLHF